MTETTTTTTTIPDGWKLVPIEPTHEMMQAAYKPVGNALYDNPLMDTSKGWGERGAEVYRAMLRAAPSPAPAAPSAAQTTLPASLAGLKDADPLTFTYTNWRGETAVRRARPIRVYHGATEWHPEPQWLMEAYDADKGGLRAFAVKDMVFDAQPSQGGSVSEAATVAMVIPYTDEDERPDMPEWRMISIGRPGDIPDHVLDRIPAKAAGIICEAINAASLSAARASAPEAPEVVDHTQIIAAARRIVGSKVDPRIGGRLILEADVLALEAALRSAGEAANG